MGGWDQFRYLSLIGLGDTMLETLAVWTVGIFLAVLLSLDIGGSFHEATQDGSGRVPAAVQAERCEEARKELCACPDEGRYPPLRRR